MSAIFNENGDPIEEVFDSEGNLLDSVLTPEEAEQKMEEAKVVTEEELQSAQDKLDGKEEELKEAVEALEKEQGKEKNFSKLRGKTDEKEKEITTLRETIDELAKKVDGIGQVGKERNVQSAIDGVVGKDEELSKKVKFFYDQFAGEPENDEKFKERIQNSVTLATGGKSNDALSGDAVAFGGGEATKESGGGKISGEEQDLAGKLGIDNNELKRHKLI